MVPGRIIEYSFFFSTLAFVGFVAWQVFTPFFTAIALASTIVIICYPVYDFILRRITRGRQALAALLATLLVFTAIVVPISLVSTLLVNEFVSFYRSIDNTAQLPVDTFFTGVEDSVRTYIPGFEINLSDQIKQTVSWTVGNFGTIFAGTVSVVFTFLIAMLCSFYLFRDGSRLVAWIISISPLKDKEDLVIMHRIAQSIRSVATGTVLVAIIQGFVATAGFTLFGIERPILWGSVAALGALLPGVGTLGIMVPAVAYLFLNGTLFQAIGLAIWGAAAVVIVDNFLGPYFMSRGNNLHPFVVLLAVIGGVSLFGPIGFILGPVVISLFMVLIEIYSSYIAEDVRIIKKRR
jgi:predicted PurR-regulated permease PerM